MPARDGNWGVEFRYILSDIKFRRLFFGFPVDNGRILVKAVVVDLRCSFVRAWKPDLFEVPLDHDFEGFKDRWHHHRGVPAAFLWG
jgi:hypothetical protein